jgi:hypothetical protein
MAMPTASDLYNQALKQLQGYGNSQQLALQQSYQNSVGQGMQSLASSGLAGTTVAPSMRMGYMKSYQQALNALGEQLQQSRINVNSTLGLGALQDERQQQQLANQLELGRGNLAVSQRQAAATEKQLALQEQNQGFNQQFQQKQFDVQYPSYGSGVTYYGGGYKGFGAGSYGRGYNGMYSV